MYQSGFDQVIRPQLTQVQLVYVETSAGSVVASATLRGFELVDEPDVVVPRSSGEVIWDGLGLIDFTIGPHYASDNPEIGSPLDYAIKPCAWMINCLCIMGVAPDSPLIADSLSRLEALQQDDGRWSGEDGEGQDVHTTLETLRAISFVRPLPKLGGTP